MADGCDQADGGRMTIIREERIGGQRLILGDCLKVMPTLGRFDAVVTDPPYGINMDRGARGGGYDGFGRGAKRKPKEYVGGWDASRPDPAVFDGILDLADRHIIWGGNYFTDLVPVSGKWLFWDKCQTMPSFSDGEMAWTTLPGDSVKQFTYNGSGLHAKEKQRVHPTQKPVALMEWCLGFLPDAQTILDPFCGSGTTLVACERMGKQGTGIERDPDYFEVMCRRVEEATRQPDMFVPQPEKPKQETFL